MKMAVLLLANIDLGLDEFFAELIVELKKYQTALDWRL